MDIKIGITNIQRELVVELDQTDEALEAQILDCLATGGVLRLTDAKGRKVFVPGDRIGYVDLGQPNARPVGFGQL